MWRLIFGLLLQCAVLNAIALDEGLEIGGATISLGMNRAKAWDLLKKYDVKCLSEQTKSAPECNSWWVWSKNGKRKIVLGSVYFSKDGQIRKLFKYYDSNAWQGQPEKFVSFLYEILWQYGKSGETFAASVAENRQPGSIVKDIAFQHGRKSIRVGYVEGGFVDGKRLRPAISVHEQLE